MAEYERTRKFQAVQELATLERVLQPPLFDEELNEVNMTIMLDTGQWLLTHQAFTRWMDHNSIDLAKRVLWICGIPGSGW